MVRSECDPYPEEKIGSGSFSTLIDDMFETMRDYNGVGLAAPQVQEPYRIIVYELQDTERYDTEDGPIEPTVLVNPSIIDRSESTVNDTEGCLSLPELRGDVRRSKSVTVRYQDENATTQEKEATGFEARIIQHELDHLDGVLFVDRMEDPETLCFLEEYKKFHADDTSSN